MNGLALSAGHNEFENPLIPEKAQAFDAANIREVAERMFEFD